MLRCPICRSTEIFPVAGGCLGSLYRCKACGFQGSFVMECAEENEERHERRK